MKVIMNIWKLKEYIKDLPDDMEIVIDWIDFHNVYTQFNTNRVFFE